jgi:ABC-type branched-subunit amino acid transport system ATPase component/branched-subunit amino acid ABC-type transport system permease component
MLALGIVLIYRGSKVVNFAQGAIAMVTAYVYVALRQDASLAFAPAAAISLLAASAIGVATYSGVIRRLAQASWLVQTISTIAVAIVLQSAATLRYGSNVDVTPSSLPTTPVKIATGVVIGTDQLALAGIAIVLTAVLALFYRRSRFGIATTAAAENELGAHALGISSHRLGVWNWALGGAVGGLAGILLVPIIGLGVTPLSLLIVTALAAALVGGFTSFWLTLAGGLGIGIAESEASRFIHTSGSASAAPLLIVIALLVIRGRSLPTRGEIGMPLPNLGTGRVQARAVVPILAIIIVCAWTWIPADWVTAATVTVLFAFLCLPLVVLTGYCGQISLAQLAFAGLGAFFAGEIVVKTHLPFECALIIGALGVVPVGLLVAIPAIRTRGASLAIATLALAAVVEAALFDNVSNLYIGVPRFFGLPLNGITNPRAYLTFSLLVFVTAAIVMGNIRRSRSGRRLVAVRSNERAAAALGINVQEAKAFAFAVSAAIGGLAGILLAFQAPYLVLSNYDTLGSVNLLAWSVIGGIGYLIGPLFAGMFAPGSLGTQLSDLLGPSVQNYLPLVGGILLLFVLFKNPNGLADPHIAAWRRLQARLSSLVHDDDRSVRGSLPAKLPVSASRAGAEGDDGRQPQRDDRPPLVARGKSGLSALEISDVTVRFGGVVALSDVSFRLEPGEVVGLIGSNGAGKTTLIDVVSGYVRPASGHIRLGETVLDEMRPHARARVGISRSFQSLELFDDLTVEDNLRVAGEDRSRWAYLLDLVRPRTGELHEAALLAVREFGLDDELDKMPTNLSYGRRRLVAIARAVAAEPQVLLLDEPAAGLDQSDTNELGRLVRRLATDHGIAVLVVEHHVGMVMDMSDRVVVLEAGRVIADATPMDVQRDPAVARAYLGTDSEQEAFRYRSFESAAETIETTSELAQ